MKKEVGYGVSILGIVIMAIGFGMVPINWEFLDLVDSNYVAGAGVLLVALGIFVSMNKKKGRRPRGGGENEVPIYEGVGKNRKIVGYRKD